MLQKMVKTWPFFTTLLSNMDMVMAKSDLAIASRYVALVPDAQLAQHVFGLIEAEWARTEDALARITGTRRRLAGNPALARSIAYRLPYIDPLNHLQVELMRRVSRDPRRERAERPDASRHPHVDQRVGGRTAQLGVTRRRVRDRRI